MKKYLPYVASATLITLGLLFVFIAWQIKLEEWNQKEVLSFATSIVSTAQSDFYNQMTQQALPSQTPIATQTQTVSNEKSCTITTNISGNGISANVYVSFIGDEYFENCVEWLRLNKDTKVDNGVTIKTVLDENYIFQSEPIYCTIKIRNTNTIFILSSDVEKIGENYCGRLIQIYSEA